MNERKDVSSLEYNRRDIFLAAVGYVSFMCWISLALGRRQSFVTFHARQAIVLFCVELSLLVIRFIPVIGEVISLFGMVSCGICSLVGVYKVLRHEQWEIPVVFDIAALLPR